MILSAEQVKKLIPQDDPMVMVGDLLYIDEKTTICQFTIPQNHILSENNLLNRTALIENMAQTAAVRAGYLAKQTGSIPKTGFIGSIKNFEILATVSCGQTLTTTIINTGEIFNASIIEGKIECDRQLIARGEMNIFLLDTIEN